MDHSVPKSLNPTKQKAQNKTVPKDPSEFVATDFRMIEKNAKAKKILICGLGPDEYNRISLCSNAKHIWDALQTAHEETNQVKRSRIELLMRNYELFSMKESEPIQDMMTRFTIITNELKSLGKFSESFQHHGNQRSLQSRKPRNWTKSHLMSWLET
ncbi:PREDICTED: uncharacterized protein LOC109217084 [Nicotiana attenuata]|uniref:uncharacterized protein LOC109217084 n=1 Tax=Nicotiana attenuata TaxID=49451 RepID=UPI000905D3F4|nr:PREDICTED: uncharacterized protein LOC109217084 [Nicotiana attenuata]